MVLSSVENLLARMRAARLRQEARYLTDQEDLIRAGLAPDADEAARYAGRMAQAMRDRRLPACC
jgi:hypothetical protein